MRGQVNQVFRYRVCACASQRRRRSPPAKPASPPRRRRPVVRERGYLYTARDRVYLPVDPRAPPYNRDLLRRRRRRHGRRGRMGIM